VRDKDERRRSVRVMFRLDEAEAALMEEKMAEAGIQNREAYIRRMVLDGYVLKLDFSDVRRMVWLLSNVASNLNQIAKRANETRSVSTGDVQALQAELNPLWGELRSVMRTLAKL